MNHFVETMFEHIHSQIPLDQEAHQDWSKISEIKELKKDQSIVKNGEFTENEYFVVQGLVRGFYNLEDQEKNVSFFHENKFITPWHIRTTHQRSAINLQALEDTTIIQFNQEKFTQLRYRHDSIRKIGENIVHLELTRLRNREQQLLGMSAPERYEAFIEDFPNLVQRLNQYHIASYLNISPVSLSRLRAKY